MSVVEMFDISITLLYQLLLEPENYNIASSLTAIAA